MTRHKGGFIVDGGVRVKVRSQFPKTRRRQLHKVVIGSFCISLILIGFMTPIPDRMVSRMRGLWIQMNQSIRQYHNKVTEVKNIKLSLEKVGADSDTPYDYITKPRKNLYEGNLVLINGNHGSLFLEKKKLVSVDAYKNTAYKCEDSNMKLNREMIVAFNEMMQEFEKATGKRDMIITSAYRTLQDQETILQEKINLFGEEGALKWAMLPGYSEHHSGYAVDLSIYTDDNKYISYTGQDEYAWINQNCYRFGFIRRYTEDKEEITGVVDEQWHYRYIGVPHSYVATEKNFCLEEYIAYLKNFTFDQQHLQVESEAGMYEIYFVPSQGKQTTIPVPENDAYEISGNNVDGFIVTVALGH